MPALLAVHTEDPRKEIMKKVKGQLPQIELFGNSILVATYMRPAKAKHGTLELHLADVTRKEDEYQGKVGLILKMGPRAYVSDETYDFHGQVCKVGDWVVYRPSDGWALTLPENKVSCRILVESSIRMRIESPDIVW